MLLSSTHSQTKMVLSVQLGVSLVHSSARPGEGFHAELSIFTLKLMVRRPWFIRRRARLLLTWVGEIRLGSSWVLANRPLNQTQKLNVRLL